MSPTLRLHYDDPLLLHFDARILRHAAWNDAPSLILDRSAFYPESGGQMADHGTLNGHPVIDVQVDDSGTVHHILQGSLPPADDVVTGDIDRTRRRIHMALHTGQHLLSRALVDEANADTVSARLGETLCTIDVDQEVLDERAVHRAEALVNAAIDDDLPIRQYFPAPQELAQLPLRRAPKVTDHIRVVAIGDFDVSPCGGTHCTRTAQVGFVRVTGLERYKGKARVIFSAGPRARNELAAEASLLRSLGREFTCGPLDVRSAIDKLRRELTEAREALGHTQSKIADVLAAQLVSAAITRRAADAGDLLVLGVVEDASVDLLRKIARKITMQDNAVALLAGHAPDGLLVHISRGAASSFACGAFLKRAAAAAGGRGGGRPESAEGRLPLGTDWAAIVALAAAK